MPENLPQDIKDFLLKAQQNEITENLIYSRLAKATKNQANQATLIQISQDELNHYQVFKSYTKVDLKPNKWIARKYFWTAKLLGLTFGAKLMEQGEAKAQLNYGAVIDKIPEIKQIIADEDKHEQALISLINEEKLKYVGSVVLGLNDALVELTGTLAGLTFALQNTRLISLSGLIMGIAASFSMAASEYLSAKAENNPENSPLKSAIATGIAYVFTVFSLILPYFIFNNFYYSLALMFFNALAIIFVFNFYLAVVQELNFRKRFLEMAGISFGVAFLSFGIGILARMWLDIEL